MTNLTPEKIAEHKAQRREHWAQRMPQLLASAEVCPYWQFRAVGDAADPPACRAVDGHLARFDSEFWKTHSPAKCRRQMCRCTIRAYSQREFDAKGLALSPPLAAKE